MSARVLRESDWGSLSVDDERGVVLIVRSSKIAEDVDGLHSELANIAAAVKDVPRHYGVVFDMRAVRGRHDPRLEDMGREAIAQIESTFDRMVMLVKTEVGALQVRRMQRSHGHLTAEVTTDEAEAVRYAAGEGNLSEHRGENG